MLVSFFRRDCELIVGWLVAMCLGTDVILLRVKKTFICQTKECKGIYKMCWFSILFSLFSTLRGDDKKLGAKKNSFCYWDEALIERVFFLYLDFRAGSMLGSMIWRHHLFKQLLW